MRIFRLLRSLPANYFWENSPRHTTIIIRKKERKKNFHGIELKWQFTSFHGSSEAYDSIYFANFSFGTWKYNLQRVCCCLSRLMKFMIIDMFFGWKSWSIPMLLLLQCVVLERKPREEIQWRYEMRQIHLSQAGVANGSIVVIYMNSQSFQFTQLLRCENNGCSIVVVSGKRRRRSRKKELLTECQRLCNSLLSNSVQHGLKVFCF